MSRFVPTLGMRDTGENVRNFVRENMNTFWDIFHPLMPYIVILYFIDMFYISSYPIHFPLGTLISTYFMMALAISWHRVVIHGADNYVPVNPLKPTWNELVFMGMGVFLIVLAVISMISIAFFASKFWSESGMLFVIVAAFSLMFLGFRVSFYFPAKATNASISLNEAYRMSKGMCFKLFFANILATLLFSLVFLVYSIVLYEVIPVLAKIDMSTSTVNLISFLLMLPAKMYFEPIITILGITVLSNYYQYALQNKKELYSSDDPR